MKKRILNIISILLVLFLIQGFCVFAADTPKEQEYTMTAGDYSEFCDMLSSLLQSGGQKKSASERAASDSGDFDSTSDNSDFASMRLIVRTDGTEPDLTGNDIVCSIKGPGDFYIIQLGSVREAENCAKALAEQDSVRYAVTDTEVWLCDSNEDVTETNVDEQAVETTHMSWGADYIESDYYVNSLIDAGITETVTVAVVDSGIARHDLLNGVVTSNGKDFVGSDPRNDENGHGTHVAGIVADCTQGLDVELMPVRVLAADGKGYTSSVVAGIEYAISMGVDVINYSIAGEHDQSKDDAVNDAYTHGITFVCASGNGGENINGSKYCCPSHNENAVVVGAIRQDGERYSLSNYGVTLDFVAPGNAITSCGLYNDTAIKSGTSMATAFITAVAAMYRLECPSATSCETVRFISEISSDLGEEGFDIFYGYGVPKLSAAHYSGVFSWRKCMGGIEITGITDAVNDIIVPPTIGGYQVTGIADTAFLNCDTIKTIKLPDGLKYIGAGAFHGCAVLEEINVPDSVISVGDYAFFGCTSLTKLRFGALTASFGQYCAGYTGSVSEPNKISDFVVEGYSGTSAESFAFANGLAFEESQKLQITAEDEQVYLIPGGRYTPDWTVYPSSLSSICSFTLLSSDDSVVLATSGNKLTAVGVGTAQATLTANYNGDSSSYTIDVTVISSAIELSSDSVSLNFKDTAKLTVTVTMPGYTTSDIVWNSNNASVATVSDGGVLTATSRGTTTVTASTSDGYYSAVCMVKVGYSLWQWIIMIVFFGWIWYR